MKKHKYTFEGGPGHVLTGGASTVGESHSIFPFMLGS